ncbi:MAG: hypothetical protein M3313_16090 [Actinomycetota bacterium]|nr:hypothetical protein [Actinomycetota bacterium]
MRTGSEVATERPAAAGTAVVRWPRLLLVLLAVSSALVAVSLFLPVLIDHELTRDRGDLRIFTYVNDEANLPTWWTVSLLLGAAVLHVFAGALARRCGVGGAAAWWIFAVLLALLALDELTALHERLDVWGLALTEAGFAFPWLVLGAPIALTMLVIALVASRHLPRRSMTLSLGGLGLLFVSAVGLEALGGLMLGEQAGPYEGSDLGYTLVMHLEEFGEMAGAALAACSPLAALLLRRSNSDLALSLDGR